MNTGETHNIDDQKYLERYFLQRYLYSGMEGLPEEAVEMKFPDKWSGWHYAVMIEFGKRFFDRIKDFDVLVAKELRRDFFYLNLNARQSLMLFKDAKCDYRLIVKQIRQIIRRRYSGICYFAISSKFDGAAALPGVLACLEQLMEERFYHPERGTFLADEENSLTVWSEVQDSLLMDKISEDVSRKDVTQLWRHYGYLRKKYTANTQYSSMYVKFVFSGVIQELFSEEQFAEERDMSAEVTRLYQAMNLADIMNVTEDNIRAYERFINESNRRSAEMIGWVEDYIKKNCGRELTPEILSVNVGLTPGYLRYIFRKEKGMCIPRYIKICRMKKARKMLLEGSTEAEAARECGFNNDDYLRSSFREYFGIEP